MLWPFNFKWHIQIQVVQTQAVDSLASMDTCFGARCLVGIKGVGKSG